MHSKVSHALTSLRKTMLGYRLLAIVESAVAACLFPALLLTPASLPAKVFSLVLVCGYAWFKWSDVAHSSQLVRQLRLEFRFVAQGMNVLQLTRCLNQDRHLWSSSLVLQGLRSIQSHPLPRLLDIQARTDRLTLHFRRALGPLQWSNPAYSWVLPLAAALLLFPNRLPAGTSVGAAALYAALGLFLAASIGEVVMSMLRRRLRMEHGILEDSLGAWALDAGLYHLLFDRRKLYAHILLYEAPPWL